MHPKTFSPRLLSAARLLFLLLQLSAVQCRFATTGTRARNIHLTSNINTAERISEGQKITLTCSDISTTRSRISGGSHGAGGGSVGGRLRILRKRSASSGGGSDGFEDMANIVSLELVAPELRDIKCSFEVTRLDDEAVFICGDAETLAFTTHMPASATVTLRVQFKPRSLTLNSLPSEGMQEGSAKIIMCKTDEGGSNPPANITWKHLSPLGAIEPLTSDMQYTQEVTQARRGGFVTRSNLTVTAHRELNGHRIECAVETPERMLLFRQTETLEVFFAPNSVRIHPVPTGGVREGDWVQLTCAVSVSHPPATVRWFELPVSPDGASAEGQEITDLAQIDMTPGEFGGMLVDSTLRVSKTFRTNANTEYRCIVHQAALRAPVIAEYKLNVLYPPTVEIISLPPDPTEAQSVTLSCLAHGGNPPEDMRFSWRYAKTLDLTAYEQPPSGNMDPVFAKNLVSSLNTSQITALFSTMQRKPGQLHRHLMLDSVDVKNMGWYGCEVNNAGGTAQTLHLLLADFAPRMRTETKFIQHAEIGMPSELVLVVDTRPSRADVTWFWIEEGSSLANKARNKILAQRDGEDVYDSGITRLSRSPGAAAAATGNTSPLKVVSTSSAPWLGRVRKSSLAVAPDRLKVSLSFREVRDSDFGIYMCQLNHKAGSREFYFELKPQSAARGIKPESVKISSDGRIARLEFEPPNSQFYSRIVLRICLAVKQLTTLPGSAGTLRPLTGPAFLRPVHQRQTDNSRRLQPMVDTSSSSVRTSGKETEAVQSGATDGENECTDYQVTFAELGYLQVEIERPISEYTFQFLVYMDSELKQVTRPVRWTGEPKQVDAASQKFFIQLIIGILTTLIAICLVVLTIYYLCSLFKRRGHKKMTVDLPNGVHPSLRPYQIMEPGKPLATLGGGQGSIGAGSGSLQPLYPRQSIGSSCTSGKGLFAAQNLSLTTSPTMLDSNHFQLHSSSSVGSQMSTLTQRLISEVYMAAAKAASRAVTESIASGSIEGVEIQDHLHLHHRHDDGGSTFRQSSQYAESGSITGGSLSGIEGLNNYPAVQMTGNVRSTSVNETGSQRSNTPRFSKSPATSVISPNSDQVFQFGQRRTSVISNGHQNWSALPLFTPNATRRLNEAASALAAAATAAVLEATQASPLPPNSAVSVGPRIARFGSTSMTTHATSSEDGESTNSSTFFPRKRGLHDSHNGGHFGRKRVLQNSRRTSVSRGGDCVLPMLAVPMQFIPTSTPSEPGRADSRQSDNYLRSPNEAERGSNGGSDSTTDPATALAGGPWAPKFQPINTDEASHKSSPYSDCTADVTLSTFTSQPNRRVSSQQGPQGPPQAPPSPLSSSPAPFKQPEKALGVDTLRPNGSAVMAPASATAEA